MGKQKEKAFHSQRISGCLAVTDAPFALRRDPVVIYFDCVIVWSVNKDVLWLWMVTRCFDPWV